MGHIAANMCDFVGKGDKVAIEYTTRETRQHLYDPFPDWDITLLQPPLAKLAIITCMILLFVWFWKQPNPT
jgi:hypothetical protein